MALRINLDQIEMFQSLVGFKINWNNCPGVLAQLNRGFNP